MTAKENIENKEEKARLERVTLLKYCTTLLAGLVTTFIDATSRLLCL